MKRTRKWEMSLALLLSSALTGSFSFTGCAEKVAKNYNPCGTILNCDAEEYELMMHDWPDWDLDPTCTIPGKCDGVFPNNNTGGTTPTTTTTTTGTTGTGFGGFGSFF